MKEVAITILLAFSMGKQLTLSNYFSHSPLGCDFICRVEQTGSKASWRGENLFQASIPRDCTLANAFYLWFRSPEHLAVWRHTTDYLTVKYFPKNDGKGCYIVYESMEW